jgi:exodeoxyribonuclease VII small subunit
MSEGKKNFEDAIAELEKIVNELEKGELSLDDSVEMFQRGIELSKYCSKRLDDVERKITLLIEENGSTQEKSFIPGDLEGKNEF